MTPDALARLHREAFQVPPPWSEQDFAGFLADDACFLCAVHDEDVLQAFALFRIAADEAELLTLATRLDARRKGLARAVLQAGLAEAQQRGAIQCFLEVAADNLAALDLYHSAGFVQQGIRRGYYSVRPLPPVDARVLRIALEQERAAVSQSAHSTIISC